ncbi:hypothetical protein KKF84_07935 [Myxococcota bacterium]|nr:hypothetical protein [Myxococcota bacterium]MBU1535236.1 hypothetical protein [Myxococcota bacterium]
MKYVLTLSLLVSLLLINFQCGRQDFPQLLTPNPSHDGGVDGDADITDAGDDADVIDPPPACGESPLEMAFALQTDVAPVTKAFDAEDYILAGDCTYHGPLRTVISGDSRLDHEVEIEHGDGSTSVFQYFIPFERDIPMATGMSYTVTYRVQPGFESSATGVKVERNTSGLVPLIFIGDAGEFGRAFTENDPLMEPLQVIVIDQDTCAPTEDPVCGGDVFLKALLFDPVHGGGISLLGAVQQGKSNVVNILGDEFLVTNLRSSIIEPTCPDQQSTYVSYMALRPPSGEIPCDTDRIQSNLGDAFAEGNLCDEVEFCASPELAGELKSIAPALECYEDGFACDGDLQCVWYTPTNLVGAETYYEVCSVSLLLPESTSIFCNVYFD